MNDSEFQQLADMLYQKIEDKIEESGVDIDYDQNGGLLTLEFENRTKLIINRQQPLHQIWLATPKSGHHYNYVTGAWIDDRNGDDFLVFLSATIFKQSNEKVVFN
ncbi:iron donor protein CyaY [Psychromonas antarctica]|jgi:CyaY protein|uniref:iron donor protein CyaY n=1 Tax=Psychromonas antarctica TaxID=67573 RepID=UPI001EE872F7|nr:iron donor protein CyaY [Psychromonas antarctica]MCG6202156.1 iron donor protein CyaY [Psychromonas antarctica]